MKNACLIFLLFAQTTFSQQTDSLGLDNNPILNPYESAYFNDAFKDQRGDFDFTNARIAFVTGSSGSRLIDKQYFFLEMVKPWLQNNSKPALGFVRLNEAEKRRSGGYDAVVLVWVKVFTKQRQRKIVRKLGSRH